MSGTPIMNAQRQCENPKLVQATENLIQQFEEVRRLELALFRANLNEDFMVSRNLGTLRASALVLSLSAIGILLWGGITYLQTRAFPPVWNGGVLLSVSFLLIGGFVFAWAFKKEKAWSDKRLADLPFSQDKNT